MTTPAEALATASKALNVAMSTLDYDNAAVAAVGCIEATTAVNGIFSVKAADAWNFLGLIEHGRRNYEAAIAAYNQSRQILEDPQVTGKIGHSLIMTIANSAEAHGLLRNWDKAQTLALEALQLADQAEGAYIGRADIYQVLAGVCEADLRWDDAERHLMTALSLVKGSTLPSQLTNVRLQFFGVLMHRADFQTAAIVRDDLLAEIDPRGSWRESERALVMVESLGEMIKELITVGQSCFIRDSLVNIGNHLHDEHPQTPNFLRQMARWLREINAFRIAQQFEKRADSLMPPAP